MAQTIVNIELGNWDNLETRKQLITLAKEDDEPDLGCSQVTGIWSLLYKKIYPPLYKQLSDTGTSLEALDARCIQEKYRIEKSNYMLIVAKQEGKIIGYCIWSFPRSDNGRCRLEYLLVDKEYRKRGMGEALIRTFLMWAEKANRPRIKVHFDVTNPALLRFFSKLGFVSKEKAKSWYFGGV